MRRFFFLSLFGLFCVAALVGCGGEPTKAQGGGGVKGGRIPKK